MYSLPNIIRVIKSIRMRWAGHVARMGDKSGAYRFWVEYSGGKSPVGRPRRIWEGNIKMNLLDVGWGGLYRIDVPQRRESWRAIVNVVMHVRILQNNRQGTHRPKLYHHTRLVITPSIPPQKTHLNPWHTTAQGTSSHQTRPHTRHASAQFIPPHKASHHTKHTTTEYTPQPAAHHHTKNKTTQGTSPHQAHP